MFAVTNRTLIECTCYNEKTASNTLVVHKTVICVIVPLKNTRLKDNPKLTECIYALFILYVLFVPVNILLRRTYRRHRTTCFYHRLLFGIVSFLRSYRRCDHSATATVKHTRFDAFKCVRVKIASHHLVGCRGLALYCNRYESDPVGERNAYRFPR